jgi:excisionase family DNA binding protein
MTEEKKNDEFTPIDWITTGEAAELTGYTSAYFRQMIHRGRIHARKRGRDWFMNKEEVKAYAEEMKRLGGAKHDPWRTGARKRSDAKDDTA